MNMPILKVPGNRGEKYTLAFRGVNYGEGALDGELEDSRNVTSERFPCLCPRAGRNTEGAYESATAVYFKGKMLLVDGTKLLYDGEEIATVTPGKKQFATVNSKVVVFPDKIVWDSETGEVRSLGAVYTSVAGSAEIIDGKTIAVHQGAYSDVVVSSGNIGGTVKGDDLTLRPNDTFVTYTGVTLNTETGVCSLSGGTTTIIAKVREEDNEGYTDYEITSQNVKVGTIFTKVTDVSTGNVLVNLDPAKQWAVVTEMLRYAPTYPATSTHPGYTKSPKYGFDYEIHEIQGESYGGMAGFEAIGFRVGDTVEIEGLVNYSNQNGTYTIRGFGTTTVGGTALPTIIFDDSVFPHTGVDSGAVTIRRKVPNLSVVCENDNRLWGAEGNTIYASALGDPTNFFTYDGLDTDSYAVAVASEGEFTGCCGFGNSVLFWKEDRLLKVLGDYPSQYTMYEYQVPGVKRGSEGSLWNINETLYYHSREGVYRYNGGSPELISENFGLRRFQNAAAGAEGDRYYISMQDVNSQAWGLWVYDVQRGLWLQEDESQGVDFAYNDGKLYFINGEGSVVCVNPDMSEEAIAWSATTTRMDETHHGQKCYSRLKVRADIPEGAWLQVEVSCDGKPFQQVYIDHDARARVREIPIQPRGCDYFRVRLSGEGPVIIRGMVREYRMSRAVR